MRHIIFAVLLSITASNVASGQRNAPYASVAQLTYMDKIFPPVPDIKWYTEGRLDKLVFYRNSATVNVFINKKGTVVKVTRYYTEADELPVFLLAKLLERFPAYSLTAVIEEQDEAGINYMINVSGKTDWLKLHADISGRFTVIEKYNHPESIPETAHKSTFP